MTEVICTAAAVGAILAYARREPKIEPPYLASVFCPFCHTSWLVISYQGEPAKEGLTCDHCGCEKAVEV